MLGQHAHPKEKENEMETKADQLNEGDPQPMRPLEKYHHAPNIECHTPNRTFKKESDNNLRIDIVAPLPNPTSMITSNVNAHVPLNP
jgi:hypothetical protein